MVPVTQTVSFPLAPNNIGALFFVGPDLWNQLPRQLHRKFYGETGIPSLSFKYDWKRERLGESPKGVSVPLDAS